VTEWRISHAGRAASICRDRCISRAAWTHKRISSSFIVLAQIARRTKRVFGATCLARSQIPLTGTLCACCWEASYDSENISICSSVPMHISLQRPGKAKESFSTINDKSTVNDAPSCKRVALAVRISYDSQLQVSMQNIQSNNAYFTLQIVRIAQVRYGHPCRGVHGIDVHLHRSKISWICAPLFSPATRPTILGDVSRRLLRACALRLSFGASATLIKLPKMSPSSISGIPDLDTFPKMGKPLHSKLEGYAFYRSIGSPRHIVAPMVDQSELAWRILSRRYGSDLVYSPMINAKIYVQQNRGAHRVREGFFNQDHGEEGAHSIQLGENKDTDRPLIVQVCCSTNTVLCQ